MMSLLVMEPPSKDVLEIVRGEFGLNEQRVGNAVEHLKYWIHLQPPLPKEIVTLRLRHSELKQNVHNCRNVTDEAFAHLSCFAAYVGCGLPTFRTSLSITKNMVRNIRQ